MKQSRKQEDVFKKQRQHLESIAAEEWENLIELSKMMEKEGLKGEALNQFQEMLYDLENCFQP